MLSGWVLGGQNKMPCTESVEAKCTQAVRELASQRVQGDGNGFALCKLVDVQSEIRCHSGWWPQEAAPSSAPPCDVS